MSQRSLRKKAVAFGLIAMMGFGLWVTPKSVEGHALPKPDVCDAIATDDRPQDLLTINCSMGQVVDLDSTQSGPDNMESRAWPANGGMGIFVTNRNLTRLLLGGRSLTLGEVLVKAKAATETRDSRRTEMFFVRSGRSAQVAIIRPSSVVRRLVSRFRFSYKAVTLRQLTTDQGF